MACKPVLHYFDGRGRAEIIRWLFAAADVEYDEKLYTTKEDYDNLVKSGDLLYQQIPMVDIDGMKLVQTSAILNYIAAKHNLYGEGADPVQRAYIDMYANGAADLVLLILSYFFMSDSEKEKQRNVMKDKAVNRYFPVFNKALEGKNFLVGKKLSMADVYVLYAIYSLEEFHPDILKNFANLQAFKKRISEVPSIKKFLDPGSKRKPMADEVYITTVLKLIS